MIHGLITLALLIVFLLGTAAVFAPRHRRELDAAARLPLDDELLDQQRRHAGSNKDRP